MAKENYLGFISKADLKLSLRNRPKPLKWDAEPIIKKEYLKKEEVLSSLVLGLNYFKEKGFNIIDKQDTGNGFTYGVFQLTLEDLKKRGLEIDKLIILEPNSETVRGKAYATDEKGFPLHSNVFFKTEGVDTGNQENADIMCMTTDMWYNRYKKEYDETSPFGKNGGKIAILIDESHKLVLDSSFRKTCLLKNLVTKNCYLTSVTATVPDGLRDYVCVTVGKKRKVNAVYIETGVREVNGAIRRIPAHEYILGMLNSGRIIVASLSADTLSRCVTKIYHDNKNRLKKLKVKLVVGESIKSSLERLEYLKYVLATSEEEKNPDNIIYLVSSAGTEGYDIKGTCKVLVELDSTPRKSTDGTQIGDEGRARYMDKCAVLQVFGRSRGGYKGYMIGQFNDSVNLKIKEESYKYIKENVVLDASAKLSHRGVLSDELETFKQPVINFNELLYKVYLEDKTPFLWVKKYKGPYDPELCVVEKECLAPFAFGLYKTPIENITKYYTNLKDTFFKGEKAVDVLINSNRLKCNTGIKIQQLKSKFALEKDIANHYFKLDREAYKDSIKERNQINKKNHSEKKKERTKLNREIKKRNKTKGKEEVLEELIPEIKPFVSEKIQPFGEFRGHVSFMNMHHTSQIGRLREPLVKVAKCLKLITALAHIETLKDLEVKEEKDRISFKLLRVIECDTYYDDISGIYSYTLNKDALLGLINRFDNFILKRLKENRDALIRKYTKKGNKKELDNINHIFKHLSLLLKSLPENDNEKKEKEDIIKFIRKAEYSDFEKVLKKLKINIRGRLSDVDEILKAIKKEIAKEDKDLFFKFLYTTHNVMYGYKKGFREYNVYTALGSKVCKDVLEKVFRMSYFSRDIKSSAITAMSVFCGLKPIKNAYIDNLTNYSRNKSEKVRNLSKKYTNMLLHEGEVSSKNKKMYINKEVLEMKELYNKKMEAFKRENNGSTFFYNHSSLEQKIMKWFISNCYNLTNELKNSAVRLHDEAFFNDLTGQGKFEEGLEKSFKLCKTFEYNKIKFNPFTLDS